MDDRYKFTDLVVNREERITATFAEGADSGFAGARRRDGQSIEICSPWMDEVIHALGELSSGHHGRQRTDIDPEIAAVPRVPGVPTGW